MTFRRALLVPVILGALLAGPGLGVASAACDTFSNMSGGAWTVAGNWSGGVPGTNDDVCIAIPAGHVVTLAPSGSNTGDTVSSLTLSSGTLEVAGQANISSSDETTNVTTLAVTNAATVASGATLELDATAGGTPTPGGAAGGNSELDAGTLTNSGTLSALADDNAWGDLVHVAEITNTPTGAISVGSGTLTVTEGNPFSWTATNAGSLTVATGAALNLATSFAGSGAFTNNGAVVDSGSITSSSSSGSASWTQSSGTFAGNAISIGARSTLADAAGAGSFVLGSGATLTGTIPSGQTVTVEGAGGQTGTQVSLANATLVNNGTLVLDVPGSGTASGGSVNLTNGSIQNHGTVTSQIEDPSWRVLFQVGLANAHGATLDLSGGTLDQNGASTTNDGAVDLQPGAVFELEEGAQFTNAVDGGIADQVSGPTAFGQFETSSACCAGAGMFNAGGSFGLTAIGGFVPTAGQEFNVFSPLSGPFAGTFAAVGPGFTADYSHVSASPAYVGFVYGTASTPTPTPTTPAAVQTAVHTAKGGKGVITVGLSCPAGGAGCKSVTVQASVVERLRGKKLLSIVARAPKKQAHITLKTIVIARGSATLAAGKATTLTLKVNAAARALLAHHARLAALLTVKAGSTTLKSASISVQLAAKPKKKKG
jgi:hypothetical protein